MFLVAALAAAGETRDAAAKPWADRLKNIPLGPGKLDVGASLRLRYEHLDDFNAKGYGNRRDDDLLLSRLRLDLDYRLDENLHAFLQLQDARYTLSHLGLNDFGDTCSYENPLDLRQAHLEWQHIADTPFGFKVGRQIIAYADGRIWGPGEWGNAGRYAWDAVKLYWDTEVAKLDVLYAQRVIGHKKHFDDQHYDYEAYGMYLSVKKLPAKLDFFYVDRRNDHDRFTGERGGPADHKRHTVGTYVDGKFLERFDYGGTFAYQFGHYGKDKIRAHGLNSRLGYTFDAKWKPRVGVEYTRASGDSDPNDGRRETFDGAFGAVDRFYGRMNLFSWMNIQDYQASFSVKPIKKLKVSLDYHCFRLAQSRDGWYYCSGNPQARDRTGSSGSSLGHEIDLIAKYALSNHLELMCGYGHFWPSTFVENNWHRRDNADWLFVQATLTF